MVSIGGISLPGSIPPSLHHQSSPTSAIGFARFPDRISFRSSVVLRDEVEKKGSRVVIVNGKVDGLGKSECETDFDTGLGNGRAGNLGIASILMFLDDIILNLDSGTLILVESEYLLFLVLEFFNV